MIEPLPPANQGVAARPRIGVPEPARPVAAVADGGDESLRARYASDNVGRNLGHDALPSSIRREWEEPPSLLTRLLRRQRGPQLQPPTEPEALLKTWRLWRNEAPANSYIYKAATGTRRGSHLFEKSGTADLKKMQTLANLQSLDLRIPYEQLEKKFLQFGARATPPPLETLATVKTLVVKPNADYDASRAFPIRRLPPNLERLDLHGNRMKELPALPESLRELDIAQTAIEHLPKLPMRLRQLIADDSALVHIETLPRELKHFSARRVPLHDLRNLPPDLKELYVNGTPVTQWGVLPASLTDFNAAGCSLNAIPQFPDGLQRLCVAANPALDKLQSLPEKLISVDARNCALTTIDRFPPAIERIFIGGNQLRTLPELPAGLTTLQAGNNYLTEMPNLPAMLRMVNLQDNRITRVPRELLNGPADREILLRNNPIPAEEIAAIDAAIAARTAAGLASPTIIFTRQAPRNLINLGGMRHTNAHESRVLGIFQCQAETLAAKHPAIFASDTRFDFAQSKATLLAEFAAQTDLPRPEFGKRSIRSRANRAAERMFGSDAFGGEDVSEFGPDRTPKHILAAVAETIRRKPALERSRGIEQLMQHLSFADGNNEVGGAYCSTRHSEEVLSALKSAYGDDAELPDGIPWDAARDLLIDIGKAALQEVHGEHPELPEAALKARFQHQLRRTLSDHPNIEEAHIQRFFNDFAFADWDSYKQIALGDA